MKSKLNFYVKEDLITKTISICKPIPYLNSRSICIKTYPISWKERAIEVCNALNEDPSYE